MTVTSAPSNAARRSNGRARSSTVTTPVGPFSVVADLSDAVIASGWTDDIGGLVSLVAPSLRPDRIEHRGDLGELTRAIVAYHEGELHAVEPIIVNQRSGPFLDLAWKVLRAVGPGEPVSYSELALRCGRPTAVRAAASACARNSAALFVPCHRVIRADGSLGGFRWGLAVKRWLLDHESHAM